MKTRVVLESAVAEALAEDEDRSTDAAHAVLDAMDAADLTPAEFLVLDAQLHLAFAEASRNVVIAAMMAGLRTAIESYVLGGAQADRRLGCRRPPASVASTARSSPPSMRATPSAPAPSSTSHITGYYAQAGLARAPR